jgi:glutathione reductase (NADPH)
MATGRRPNTRGLGLEAAGVEVAAARGGAVVVDAWQNSSASGVYAVGDVTGRWELTPVAIAAGRLLADRLFRAAPLPSAAAAVSAPTDGSSPDGEAWRRAYRLAYEDIPTVVFSHPPVGTVGLTEAAAVARFGQARIKTYVSRFTPLFHGVTADKPRTLMKLVTVLDEGVPHEVAAGDATLQRVVGVHIHGPGADEMLQGFGVALKLRPSKADFDSSVAIHPTSAEELVTMPPWQPRLPGPPEEEEQEGKGR